MNGMATSGKNFQTVFRVADQKGAYEMGLFSPAAPDQQHHALFSSLAARQRVHVLPLQPAGKSRPARNYGGRKLRYRWLDQLKPWQVRMLHEADAVAALIGLPLNTFWTVSYHGTFPGGAAMASTFKRAMKRADQWFRDQGLPFVYAYVHENPNDERPNSHVLVHVPAHLMRAFKAKAGDWFDALDGGVDVQPRNDAQRRAKGLGTRLGYMCKGADVLTCRRYGGHRAKGGQGPITIKRAGVAQLLSKQFSDTKTTRNCGVIKGGEAA